MNQQSSTPRELYRIDEWGKDFLSVNEETGELEIRLSKELPPFSLGRFVQLLEVGNVRPPLVIRFNDLLRRELRNIYEAFESARSRVGYESAYRLAFPMKVNHQQSVIEIIAETGREYGIGLEAGSKPELLAALSIHTSPEQTILYNGYKDRESLTCAMLGTALGRNLIIILEQMEELDVVLEIHQELGITPQLGLRMKPSRKGVGRWKDSSGERSKFGLRSAEILEVITRLGEADLLSSVELLHFHIGSQVNDVTAIEHATLEAARVYVELRKNCPSLQILDVGGGLAVDYDGSASVSENSKNYSHEQYAEAVLTSIKHVCRRWNTPLPDVISESGRAVVARSTALIVEVIGSCGRAREGFPHVELSSANPLLQKFFSFMEEEAPNLPVKERLSKADEMHLHIQQAFILGECSFRERAEGSQLLSRLVSEITMDEWRELQEHEDKLNTALYETYFCNFSVFRSLPDVWALGQVFPVVPLTRLNEMPDRRAILADITCDSDGIVKDFIGGESVQEYIPVHPLKKNESYLLGFFLVGAYQEILGDRHNLFGEPYVVHVDLDEAGEPQLTTIVYQETVSDILESVSYQPDAFRIQLIQEITQAREQKRLTQKQSKRAEQLFHKMFADSTYLKERAVIQLDNQNSRRMSK